MRHMLVGVRRIERPDRGRLHADDVTPVAKPGRRRLDPGREPEFGTPSGIYGLDTLPLRLANAALDATDWLP